MDTVWKQVLAEIELEVSKATFFTFFKKTELLSVEDNIATVAAPTFMMAEQLEKRYGSLIKSILDKKLGKETSVLFTSSKKMAGALKQIEEGPLFSIPQVAKHKKPTRIKEEYQFETLAVSDSNQIAFAAAQTIAENPGGKYNPLFIYGSVGVGKTHLMHAVANKVFEKNPQANILYLTTEEFTNEVVEAIRDKNTQSLRRKFRNTDLLLLDDIQFLAGKDKVQEELFHTFNTLIDKHKQIVFTSDRPPEEIKKIESRLASRFSGGLTVDIEKPDFELRSAILLIKSREAGIPLTTDVAKLIAEKIEDTRAMEGFLLKLSSFQQLKNTTEVTIGDVQTLLGKTPDKIRMLHPDTVIEGVCDFYNIKSTQLKGSRRDSIYVRPRHICMYLLKEEARLTFFEIGNLLGGRDHTTVMHGVLKITKLLEEKEQRVTQEVGVLRESLTKNFFNN